VTNLVDFQITEKLKDPLFLSKIFSTKNINIRKNYFNLEKEILQLDNKINSFYESNVFSSKKLNTLFKERTILKEKLKKCFLHCFEDFLGRPEVNNFKKKKKLLSIELIKLDNLTISNNSLFLFLKLESCEIRIGLNNEGNNFLVKKIRNDIKFHVKDFPGSIVSLSNSISEEDIQLAANLSFLNSKGFKEKDRYFVSYSKGTNVLSRKRDGKYVFFFHSQRNIMSRNQNFDIIENKIKFCKDKGKYSFCRLPNLFLFSFLTKIANYQKNY